MEEHILSSCESVIFTLTGIPLPSLNILKRCPLHSGSSKVLSICRVVNSITWLLFLWDIMADCIIIPNYSFTPSLQENLASSPVVAMWLDTELAPIDIRPGDVTCYDRPMGHEQKKYTTCSKTLRAFPWLALLFSLCSFRLRPRMRRDIK